MAGAEFSDGPLGAALEDNDFDDEDLLVDALGAGDADAAGLSNSAGRTRGVACTLVISRARSQ